MHILEEILYLPAVNRTGLAAAPLNPQGMLLALLCLFPVPSAGTADSLPNDGAAPHSPAITSAPAVVADDQQAKSVADLPDIQRRNSLIIGSGAALVAAYGAHNWWSSGFGGGFDTTNEGWFGSGTAFGGADKLGHLYSNYAAVRLLTPLFEMAGNGRNESVALGLWSTLGTYTAVEVIDGFSRAWKFSPHDAIANAAGVALGYALETHPEYDAIFDFRVDYRRSPRSADFDPFGDYSAQKYLLVVKADGFAVLQDTKWLRYVEVAVGYGTRGYGSSGTHHRDGYIGLSLNLTRLLADGAYGGLTHSTAFQRGTERLFELVQFPSVAYARHSAE